MPGRRDWSPAANDTPELEDAEAPWLMPGGALVIHWSCNHSLKESLEDICAAGAGACAPLLRSNCLKSPASSSIGAGGLIGGRLILLLS